MKIRTAAIASALALAATGCSDFDFGIAEPEGSNPEIGGEDDFVDPGFDDGGFAVSPPARLGQVVQAERTPPPLSGGTLAVSRDGAYVVAADPDRDQIYVVRMSDGLVRKVTLEAGSEPGRVTIDGDGRAHACLLCRDATQPEADRVPDRRGG